MIAAALALGLPSAGIQVFDGFGREVTQRGIDLVRWGGRIANPAPQFRLSLPKNLSYPIVAHLAGDSEFLQFDRENAQDSTGIGRFLHLDGKHPSGSFRMSLTPAPGLDQKACHLWIQVLDSTRREVMRASVPIRVLNLDRSPEGRRYPIVLDFSHDETGFFRSSRARKIVREAADDWSYFLADQGEDRVPARDEVSELWPRDGFHNDRKVRNHHSYRGLLLYLAGIDFDEWRSGGAPSPYGKLQTVRGKQIGLCRSGTVNVETGGDYNRLGWFLTSGDQDWWISGNLRPEQPDLYSIVLHEMGHAIGFDRSCPRFGKAKAKGFLTSPQILAYLGAPSKIDATDHFPGLIDPVSGYGAFGNEYHGTAKTRRWFITKANLLCLQAVGYKLRPCPVFDALRLTAPTVSAACKVGSSCNARVSAVGGVPDYDFQIVEGSLPPGMWLDSFDGHIRGVATEAGQFHALAQVRDSDPTSHPQTATVLVTVRRETQ